MTHLLTHHGRVVARGTWSEIVSEGEDLRLIAVLTCGAHTADAVHRPVIAERGVVITIEATSQGRASV